jgi:alginate O-acetyltransferase complex protein AlgI
MIFNELSYFALFLLPAVVLFHTVPSRTRPWVIGFFGAAFFVYYGYLHFGGLWGALCVLLFVWEMVTSRLYRPGSRWCLFGIAQAVAILLVFKYLTFAVGSWNDLAATLHLPPLGAAKRWLLPLGVSFFTFEFIHFAADTYWGKLERPPVGEYAAFILFFPTMVAGPIKRFQDFGPKLKTARFDPALASQGITRILVGLAKKHAIADTFALWAGRLNGPQLYTAHAHQIVAWIFAYGMQIYFDFSAYSDIAIGSGYLFGLTIPENFNWPYGSQNIAEFWRRWHISLSSWIRDYVYVPLGGSRLGRSRTAINLILAFTISGLWHGAAYNFIAWGLWHGLLLVSYRRCCESFPRLSARMPKPVAVGLTFVAVNFGWAFFSMDIGRVVVAFSRIIRLA